MRRSPPVYLFALCLLVLSLFRAEVAVAAEPPPTVAVLYFDYTGKDQELEVLRKGLAQMLISDLSATDTIRVVERDRLEDILSELKLQGSGKIDPKSAAKLGKLLGARYLVVGGYFDLQGALRVDARIIEVETGRVVKSFGTNGKPGDFLPVEQTMATNLGQWFSANVSATAPATPDTAPATPTKAPATPTKAPATPIKAPSAPTTRTATPSTTTPHPATPPSSTPATPIATAAKKQPRPPAALTTKTAVAYAEALAALDSGDKAKAKAKLAKVVKEQPDFELASLDLDRLMK
jgi:TolB-like protein